MARPNTGEVTERLWADGNTVTFGARVRAYGKRHRLTWGTNRQGWNRTRAEIKLEEILQKVERGTWMPPEKGASVKQSQRTQPDGRQPFGAFARKVVNSKRAHGLDDDTIAGLEWKLGYVLGEFERLELLEIDVARVDSFRDELAERSRIVRDAAARGKPLVESVSSKTGKPYKRRKRALSNGSINEILTLLSQIMQRAVDYGYIERNPMRVGDRKERFLPTTRPRRTFLEVDEFHALVDAASELDREARRDRRVGRRAALATLGLTGFRISELCDMRCAQVDLTRARFKIPDAKTEKGIREVEMTLWERDELLSHREQRARDGFPMAPESHFFGTRTGGPRDPDRFRDRLLGRAVERANATRTKQGLPPLPKITPHSLRRTWAMFAAQAGRDPHWIADQIGHTSAAFTLQVYQQTRNRRLSDKERQAIWELMRFADEPTECPLTRQVTRGVRGVNGSVNGPTASFELHEEVSASDDEG
jgi:integrase